MKLVLLGPSGQLGQAVQSSSNARNWTLASVPRERLDVGDLQALTDCLDDHDFDALVNCTGFHRTDEAELRAGEAVAINAMAVARMAELCRRRQARFVHISTDYVFDGGSRNRPYTESDPPGPLNVYGASKLLGESLALNQNPGSLILRTASLFGKPGYGPNFVEAMINAALETGRLTVVNDIRMSPTSAADLSEWIAGILDRDSAGGIYHAVNSGNASWHEYALEIVRLAGVDAEVNAVSSREYGSRAMRPKYSVLDNSRLSVTLGQPLPHWTDALERYLQQRSEGATE